MRTKGITAIVHSHTKALKGFKKFKAKQSKSKQFSCFRVMENADIKSYSRMELSMGKKSSSPVTFPLPHRADRSSLFMTCSLPASALFSVPQPA